nr:10813_t:CDS:2 [Entrophospora candida]
MNEGLPERPSYRSGRKPTAVKVYTINKESKYLIIENIPEINVIKELIKLLELYGTIELHQILHDYPCEEFTEVLWLIIYKFRAAKRKVNEHIFFNSPLKVRYAPEYESVEDTREKLQERCQVIAIKTQKKNFQYKQIGYPSQTHYEHYDQNLFSTYHQPQQTEQTLISSMVKNSTSKAIESASISTISTSTPSSTTSLTVKGNDNSAGKRYYSQTQSNKETSNQSQKNRRRI